MAEVARGHGGPRRKVWTQSKILSPNIRYFVSNWYLSRFTHFLEIFGQKKGPSWVKNSVSWARSALLHGIYCIFYWVKFAITCKNDSFVAKIVNTRSMKIFMTIFAPNERLPSSATLTRNVNDERYLWSKKIKLTYIFGGWPPLQTIFKFKCILSPQICILIFASYALNMKSWQSVSDLDNYQGMIRKLEDV